MLRARRVSERRKESAEREERQLGPVIPILSYSSVSNLNSYSFK